MHPMTPEHRAALQQALAVDGLLSVCFNLGNPVLVQAAAASGAEPRLTGLTVRMADALVQELELAGRSDRVVSKAAESVAAVRAGQARLGFFAVDPARSDGIAFTPPYLLIEGGCAVRSDSPLQTLEAVDTPGVRVAVAQGSAYDLFLTRQLKQATLQRVASAEQAAVLLWEGAVEVQAGIAPLLAQQARARGGRMLPGAFMQIQQALGLSSSAPPIVLEGLAAWLARIQHDGRLAAWLAEEKVPARAAPLG